MKKEDVTIRYYAIASQQLNVLSKNEVFYGINTDIRSNVKLYKTFHKHEIDGDRQLLDTSYG